MGYIEFPIGISARFLLTIVWFFQFLHVFREDFFCRMVGIGF